MQLKRNVHGIEGIAVTMHYQRARLDPRQVRRCKVHVIDTVLQGIRVLPQAANLIVTLAMALAHRLPLVLRSAFDGGLPHDPPSRLREVMSGAYEHHGLD